MSELTLFRNQKAVVPNHVRNNTDELTRRMLGSSGGNKRISIRGNVFRMIVNGQEVAKSDDRSMDIVIVNASETVNRTYYGGVYKEGEVTVGYVINLGHRGCLDKRCWCARQCATSRGVLCGWHNKWL